MSVATTTQAVRRWIMTGSVAAVTVVGTYYGATLKEEQEVKKEKRRVLQATPEERIAQLEFARSDLVAKRIDLELKIAKFHDKRQAKEQGQAEPK
ncbi:hypothetical protein IQ06DRAFT_350031 [Phaeosphaeriaceae sp. SRC1lsM3a]|nr:hypothetical protein IQ06DRAFT_350031 [Stagonospora sp. SRC1lsM3a]